MALTADTIYALSASKKEPAWMLEKRLHAFSLWNNGTLPSWGPSLTDLDLENITYYVDPTVQEEGEWKKLPEEIQNTFEKLGIPKAEREFLGGVGAQYDSGVVYHRLQESIRAQGVIFENMDVALREHEALVQEYFMTQCVKSNEHVFASLHAAVWSGGTFIYVPKGVHASVFSYEHTTVWAI
jgi:Fe-S cluster assembly protein SufB